MTCFSPRKLFDTGYKSDTGKPIYIMPEFDAEFIYKPVNQYAAESKSQREVYKDVRIYDYILAPCGQCIGCRIDRSIEWTQRIMLEAKEYQNNTVINLSYDEDNVSKVDSIDYETGEKIQRNTLVVKHLQDFQKRLREYLRRHNLPEVRYYNIGEYGETTQRPHYHCIFFNLEAKDLKPMFNSNGQVRRSKKSGKIQYTCSWLQKLWPYGDITVDELTYETAQYVTQYITMKKLGKESEYYEKLGIQPEFVLMSRKPGIGWKYYKDNLENNLLEPTYYATNKGVQKVKLNRYFKKQHEKYHDEEFMRIREKLKEQLEDRKRTLEANTTINSADYRWTQEMNLKAKYNRYRDFKTI